MQDMKLVDPDGIYTHGIFAHPTPVEELALEVLWAQNPKRYTLSRTRDAIQVAFFGEDEKENEYAVLLITGEVVEIRESKIKWVAPHEPRRVSELWKRIAREDVNSMVVFESLFELMLKQNRLYLECRICHQRTAPHHMAGSRSFVMTPHSNAEHHPIAERMLAEAEIPFAEICSTCAFQYFGVIF